MTDWWTKPKLEDEKTQGSSEWLKWRSRGLGSSDAAALLGWSPWKNICELYEEKLGISKPEFSDAQLKAMQRGKDLEPHIRRWYEEKTGKLFPDAIGEHPEFKFMRASYDGKNDELRKIIEIKAPNNKDHEGAMNGLVPPKYIAQVQWLLLVSGFYECDYISYGRDDTHAIVSVQSDVNIQTELIKRAARFWEAVQTKNPQILEAWSSYQVICTLDLDNMAPLGI